MILNWVFVLILTMPGPQMQLDSPLLIFDELDHCEEYAHEKMLDVNRRIKPTVLASYICVPVNVVSI